MYKKDEKRDYLIKTFSRTKKKDYENYILNAIWQKMNRTDIQPVTQQYVRHDDGKYSLLDLYFPQLNYGVECDEFHHVFNVENDKEREMKIENKLNSYQVNNTFKLVRVKAYENLNSINNSIDDIVKDINLLIQKEENFEPWEIKTIESIVSEKKIISIYDKDRYRTLVDVMKLFGRNYKATWRAYYRINNDYYIWSPHLSLIVDGEYISQNSGGWINYLSDDWLTIYETRSNVDDMHNITEQDKSLRITFVKGKDNDGKVNYRFLGIYKYNEDESVQEKRVYNRISDTFDLRSL